jgi:CBS domain-containing protein
MDEKSVEAILREKKIYQVVNPKLVQAPPTMTIADAVKLMQERRAGYIVVSKGKKIVGMLTETDVLRKVLEQDVDWNRPLSDFMSDHPEALNIADPVWKAIELMGTKHFYHIPLVNDKNELVNVISVRTLIRFLAEFYPTEIYNLPPKLFKSRGARRQSGCR